MEISSNLTAEELELKNKYKLLRRLKRSVDKQSSSRKRHYLCPSGDQNQVRVVSSETALDHLKSHCVTLKAKTTSSVTEGFKKPGCWSRVDRRPLRSARSRAPEQQVVRQGTSRMMDDFEEMYSRTDFLQEHQTVVFHYEHEQGDVQHFENQHGDASEHVWPVEQDRMLIEDMDVQNDPLNQYVVEETISPGNMEYAVEACLVDNAVNEEYEIVEVAAFQCTPNNTCLMVNPQRRCVVQRYGDVVQSNNGGDEDGYDNDEFTSSIVF
uniref:Uncharacterized protein n=1 Tax=Cacopsylla melanoneura TaxID=428564 RepID=A0A8D9BEU5_9HEMI